MNEDSLTSNEAINPKVIENMEKLYIIEVLIRKNNNSDKNKDVDQLINMVLL